MLTNGETLASLEAVQFGLAGNAMSLVYQYAVERYSNTLYNTLTKFSIKNNVTLSI